MKSFIPSLAVALVVLFGFPTCSGDPPATAGTTGTVATETTEEALKPFTTASGQPFRIAVIQSGEYFAYNDVLVSIHDGLADLGWVTKVPLDAATKATIPLLLEKWAQTPSRFVELPPGAFIDLNWTEETEPPAALKALLAGEGDYDLVISLGTLAGTFVAKVARGSGLQVPVMVESVSDPVGSGIIDSFADSGIDLLTASADPEIYDRQIRLFHRVVGFERLGLIYTDTDTGRAYAALPTVTKAALDLGFDLVTDTDVLEDPPDPLDIPKAEEAYVAALERIAPRVDAVYLTIQAGLTPDSLARVLAVVEKFQLPTFVMEGTDFVWRGILLGESSSLQTIEGLYSARKLTRILQGALPRSQPQSNPHMPHIALNLAEAQKIGYDIPIDILLSADNVYTDFLPYPSAGSLP